MLENGSSQADIWGINLYLDEDNIDDMVEYAESCVILSALALEEAKLAKLEAIEAQTDYDDKYGEK